MRQETGVSHHKRLIDVSSGVAVSFAVGKDLDRRITGKFYTPEIIGRSLAESVATRFPKMARAVSIIDPFCGDGRLIEWLLQAMYSAGRLPQDGVDVYLWDCDATAVELARHRVSSMDLGCELRLHTRAGDSFHGCWSSGEAFDICITNPPWETLKPDHRELVALSVSERSEYVSLLKERAALLGKMFPLAKPQRQFAGWGTNLACFGLAAAIQSVKVGGSFGVVSPATIFGDQITERLRSWLFEMNRVDMASYYPAEMRLFEGVDQPSVFLVGCRGERPSETLSTVLRSCNGSVVDTRQNSVPLEDLRSTAYSIGFSATKAEQGITGLLRDCSSLGDYERNADYGIYVGRELDETGIMSRLLESGTYPFIKGKQVSRYSVDLSGCRYLGDEVQPPKYLTHPRIVWRDVARQSSARRMQATIIGPGYITGNSLNVLCVKEDTRLLYAILGVFNSMIFESQVRAQVNTNHLSVGSMRRMKLPDLMNQKYVGLVSSAVKESMDRPCEAAEAKVDVLVSQWYGVSPSAYRDVVEGYMAKNQSYCHAIYAQLHI